jgi:hypothetical protein
MKVSGQLHAPSALLSEKNPPLSRYSNNRRKNRAGAGVEAFEKR